MAINPILAVASKPKRTYLMSYPFLPFQLLKGPHSGHFCSINAGE